MRASDRSRERDRDSEKHIDRYKEIQLRQLSTFCVAAKEGNFTKAARTLGLSAPTVWQQVRALEQRLKTTLMRRRGRNVVLTDDGRLLLELVQPHVSGLESLESLFAARQRMLPPELTVAAIPYLASTHLIEPVRRFADEHETARLTLRVLVWFQEVIRQVEQGQAELGVIFVDRGEARSPQLEYEFLRDLPLSLLTPKRHPLTRKRSISLKDIIEYPLIVPPEGAFARRTLDQLLSRGDLNQQARIVMETPLAEVIRHYVAAGMGVALLHVDEEPAKSAVYRRPLEGWDEGISISLVTRRGAHAAEPVEVFQRLLRDYFGVRQEDSKESGNSLTT
ncbi:HTH-type transcriptional activator CmpR [Planctomycetes bacterium Pan216]|uniref:HTH-type transcriptional activator CmpR n=1 Tax=Kolteria novifilia TaxID=2527975 RepID=A0A518B085_9BACT|nr:HTH-type transcriptional activator CmpR [Planctomycetes bacterium Pan216]